MSMGLLPKDWTTANVVPIHKKGDRRVAANYRPISLTSIVVKIMERIICRKLTEVLEKSNRLRLRNSFKMRGRNKLQNLL